VRVDQDEKRYGEVRKWSRTTLNVSVSQTCGGNREGGDCDSRKRLLGCGDGSWTMSMALLDMLLGHDLSMLRIALLCDLGERR